MSPVQFVLSLTCEVWQDGLGRIAKQMAARLLSPALRMPFRATALNTAQVRQNSSFFDLMMVG
jgi:hypothetical protein